MYSTTGWWDLLKLPNNNIIKTTCFSIKLLKVRVLKLNITCGTVLVVADTSIFLTLLLLIPIIKPYMNLFLRFLLLLNALLSTTHSTLCFSEVLASLKLKLTSNQKWKMFLCCLYASNYAQARSCFRGVEWWAECKRWDGALKVWHVDLHLELCIYYLFPWR